MTRDEPQGAAIRAGIRQLAAGARPDGAAVTAMFREIMSGAATPAQIGALLMGLTRVGETAETLTGAARAMREAVIPVPRARPVIDTCGTGGSGIPRRNVSTAVALAVAACGVAVAKHGNRGISSPSGSADVLERLGVNITAAPAVVGRCIDALGVGFLYAPGLHPAMRHAAGPRRELGVRTIFNLLGPLTNPAGAARQVIGVFDPARARVLAGALGALGSERVFVVHGFREGDVAGPGGRPFIDDLSTEGESLVVEWTGERLREHRITPADAGLDPLPTSALAGGSPEQNAAALRRLLDGERGGYRTAVQLSGALALLVATGDSLDQLPRLAARVGAALDDGVARAKLSALARRSHDAADDKKDSDDTPQEDDA
ncbi:MAG: anthranilate phosphoribosyltransferase [Myxococcales bacterium]|nr:anthranilate phosphoribosyltransferase [Myxococcales bacterium]